jgi:TIR domain
MAVTSNDKGSEQLLYVIHAAADWKLAGFLKHECEEKISGLRVFVASKAGQIPTGEEWLTEIHRNLREATMFLLLLTPRSIEREWVWYEAGASWYSGRLRIPVAAGGLERGAISLPLGAFQTLQLDIAEDAALVFTALGGQLDAPETFCAEVRNVALSTSGSDIDSERIKNIEQTFGTLGAPPKLVLRKMLQLGGLTLSQMSDELAAAPERFVSDPVSVERILAALRDGQLVEGDVEGRWRIRPELERVVRQCFESPSLATRMLQLSRELDEWLDGLGGTVDIPGFNQRFWTRVALLRNKAANEFAEGDEALGSNPTTVGGMRRIAKALVDVAQRLP